MNKENNNMEKQEIIKKEKALAKIVNEKYKDIWSKNGIKSIYNRLRQDGKIRVSKENLARVFGKQIFVSIFYDENGHNDLWRQCNFLVKKIKEGRLIYEGFFWCDGYILSLDMKLGWNDWMVYESFREVLIKNFLDDKQNCRYCRYTFSQRELCKKDLMTSKENYCEKCMVAENFYD